MYDLDLVKRFEQESAVYVLNNGRTVAHIELLVRILSCISLPCDWLRSSSDKNKGVSRLSYPKPHCR